MTNTETFPPKHKLIDHLSVKEALKFMLENQKEVFEIIIKSFNQIEEVIDQTYITLKNKTEGRLIYAGAGTSARIGIQDGVELYPTFSWPKKRLGFVIAGGMESLVNSIEGAEDNVDDAIKQVEDLNIRKGDVLIGLAASGETAFTIAAIQQAKKNGALTIGISNNKNTRIEKVSDLAIVINTGYEAIAGSTRLKAGTGQKICLNLISTMLMVKFGKVKNGMMTEMIPSNIKLRKRFSLIKGNITS